jgi:hypothetical protein
MGDGKSTRIGKEIFLVGWVELASEMVPAGIADGLRAGVGSAVYVSGAVEFRRATGQRDLRLESRAIRREDWRGPAVCGGDADRVSAVDEAFSADLDFGPGVFPGGGRWLH